MLSKPLTVGQVYITKYGDTYTITHLDAYQVITDCFNRSITHKDIFFALTEFVGYIVRRTLMLDTPVNRILFVYSKTKCYN